MAHDSGPEMRTIPIAPGAEAVATAAMVDGTTGESPCREGAGGSYLVFAPHGQTSARFPNFQDSR